MSSTDRPCYCDANGCSGAIVSYNEFRQHARTDKTFEMQRLADQASQIVTEKVFELVMTSDPDISDHSVPIQCGEQTPNHSPTQIYEQLFHLDNEINSRVLRALAQMVGAQKLPVACSESVALVAAIRETRRWIYAQSGQLERMTIDSDAVALLKTSMLERMPEILSRLDNIIRTLEQPNGLLPPNFEGNIFRTDEYFEHPLDHVNPVIVILLYLVLVLSVLGRLADSWCNFTLKLLHFLIRGLVVDYKTPIADTIVQQFPRDIRGVRIIFNLEAKTIIYATCPKCCCTYEPSIQDGIPVYPSRCDYRPFPSSEPCRTRLTTSRVHNRKSIRSPIRPFVTQCPESFIAAMLSRPGIEDALSMGARLYRSGHIMTDITHGSRVQKLPGPDGKPFLEAPGTELRLMWTYSQDWFNPFYNKAAGKSASVGSITLACIFLPPSLRYRPEYLYLAGVVPGPREPDIDQITHFTTPILRKFLRMWRDGTWFTRTANYPRGRFSRSAIAAVVSDLPGARKISGQAHHKMRLFCALCLLPRDDINNLQWTLWKRRCWSDILKAGYEYRDAPDQQTRKQIFQKHGVRWSAFMELPYWNNIISVVVEGMHNFFLGLTQHHVRTVIGVDAIDPGSREPPRINEIALGKARQQLAEGRLSNKLLAKLNIPTLLVLHRDLCLPLPGNFSPSSKGSKKYLISSILMKCSTPTSNSTSPDNSDSTYGIVGEGIVDEILEEASRPSPKIALLTLKELHRIQLDICNTQRPTWHEGPPENLGDRGHGKLKADQWRSCLEFDLPVSLAYLLHEAYQEERIDDASRLEKVLNSTMLLAIALEWATSHRTSEAHATTYANYMYKYLESIRALRPDLDLLPNHHNALHIPGFLLLFGPMHGWWMFVFERVNGILQSTPTNSKLGQLEKTFLESFCAAGRIKAFSCRMGSSATLKQCSILLSECLDTDARGTLQSDIRRFLPMEPTTSKNPQISILETDIYDLLQHNVDHLKQELPGWLLSKYATIHARHEVNGLLFTNYYTTMRNSVIFYQASSGSTVQPGIIREIFTTHAQDGMQWTFLAVHPYLSYVDEHEVFSKWTDFGASIWSSEHSSSIDIVPIATRRICHAIRRRWKGDLQVLKGLSRDL